MLQDEEG